MAAISKSFKPIQSHSQQWLTHGKVDIDGSMTCPRSRFSTNLICEHASVVRMISLSAYDLICNTHKLHESMIMYAIWPNTNSLPDLLHSQCWCSYYSRHLESCTDVAILLQKFIFWLQQAIETRNIRKTRKYDKCKS